MSSRGAMAPTFTFAYGGFPLDGSDEYGCTWTCEVADGWFDGAPVRSSGAERAGQDGEEDDTPLRGARVVRFAGKVRTDDGIGALELAARRFAALPKRGEVLGSSDTLTLSGAGKLLDKPATALLSPARAAWQVNVKLADPLLYAPPVVATASLMGAAVGTGRVWPRAWPRDWGVPAGQTPGAVNVPNDGTAPYWPTLRVDGPVTNPVIAVNETGDWVRISRTVAAGQWLDIDPGQRRVLLNGSVSLAGAVTYAGRWLGVPVGGAGFTFNADSADAAAGLTIYACEGAFE